MSVNCRCPETPPVTLYRKAETYSQAIVMQETVIYTVFMCK